MHISHIALWTDDLERCKAFYPHYFSASLGNNYQNPSKGFTSCFIHFAQGASIEAMHSTMISPLRIEAGAQRMGLTHFALSVGSADEVDALTAQLRADGFKIAGEPRRTGDGFYESVVLDPDGNLIEICAD